MAVHWLRERQKIGKGADVVSKYIKTIIELDVISLLKAARATEKVASTGIQAMIFMLSDSGTGPGSRHIGGRAEVA